MNFRKKIVSLRSLKRIIVRFKKQRKTIAFTNGCFDILHYGHVSYLNAAKKPNRVLVVGLNSDASVQRIKGTGRPIVSEKSRAAVLASLACVDYVVIFREDTPLGIIKTLKPDILIKGADWKQKDIVGAEIVKSHGGRVEFIKYEEHFSTSSIIQSILKNAKDR